MIRGATYLSTRFKPDGFTGSGYFITNDVLALVESAPELFREMFFTGDERLTLSEQVSLSGLLARSYSERLTYSEFRNAQLKGKIDDPGSRAHLADEVITLTADFGRGGFGQLGFGGSITLNA